MGKRTGLGAALYLHGFDVSAETSSFTTAAPRGTQDMTGLRKSAFERKELTRDGTLSFNGFFDPDPGHLHELAAALPRTDLIATACPVGETLGAECVNLVALEYDYTTARAANGELTVAFTSSANGYGANWGQLLTAGMRTDTSATNGASLDGGAATAFGLQAFLHVFDFTGTSVTVKLQDSADNSSWADITGAGFTAATAVGAERIQTARDGAVRRYVRAVTTGTFTEAVFAVAFCRNETATVF